MVVCYWVFQCVGGMFGAGAGFWLRGVAFAPRPEVVGVTFGAEIIMTTMLVLVFLNVTCTGQSNSYFGLAIGFCVVADAAGIGRLSGTVMNPAVATGLDVGALMVGHEFSSYIW